MRKIEKRSIFCLILAALLGLGLAFFCFQFVVDGGDWASYPYNRHLYNNSGQLKGGTILDRDGDMLSTLDEDGNRIYNDDAAVRRATLHAVGDKNGNIGAGALTSFADKLSGYNLLTGVYSPLGTGNSLYFTLAAEADRQAMAIRKAFEEKGVKLLHDSYTNQQFFVLPDEWHEVLSKDFAMTHMGKPDKTHTAVRICTSWATKAENVETLIEAVKKL